MIAAAMPAMNPLPFLADLMPPEGTGTPLPPDFAALIAQLNALPAHAGAATPQIAATPEADAATDAPEVKLEADDGAVPEGLEEVADTLAAALAAVLTAAGNALAAGKAQAPVTPGSEPAKPAAPIPTLALAPPAPIPMATPPAIAAAIAAAGANLALLVGKEAPAADPAAPLSTDLPSTDKADPADALPDLLRAALSPAPASTPAAPVTAAPIFAALDSSAAPQTQSSSEMVMTHHLNMAKDGEWLDQLARDITRMANHESQLRFQLNPEHLGSLRIELANTADGTSIRMTADTEAARNMLVDAQPRLVAEARAQGLRISGAQVDLGGHGGQQRGHEQNPQAFIRTQLPAEARAIRSSAVAAERYA